MAYIKHLGVQVIIWIVLGIPLFFVVAGILINDVITIVRTRRK